MKAITPYLNFNGNAAEALSFYVQALEGQIVHKQAFGEAEKELSTPESHKDKVLHALFTAGELSFMVSDCPPGVTVTNGNSVGLALDFESEEAIQKTFAAMAQGGKITMPLENTFWGATFGMLQDKFGILWMFNYDRPND